MDNRRSGLGVSAGKSLLYEWMRCTWTRANKVWLLHSNSTALVHLGESFNLSQVVFPHLQNRRNLSNIDLTDVRIKGKETRYPRALGSSGQLSVVFIAIFSVCVHSGEHPQCTLRLGTNDKWSRFQMQNEDFTLQAETEPLKHGHQKLDVKEGLGRNELLKRTIEFLCLDNLKRRCDSYFLGEKF